SRLDSENHILLADEPAWEQFLSALRQFLGTPEAPPASMTPGELSVRELEVLELVAAGLTNEAIAERLFLSVRTVERHLSNIYAKLRLSGKRSRRRRDRSAHARMGNADGPAIVFVHGWSQCDRCWSRQVEGQLASSFRMVT